jgi:hypothetical protein
MVTEIKSTEISNVEIAKGLNSWEDAHKFPRFEIREQNQGRTPHSPSLLTYEGSYNFESSIRLDDAWKKLKALDWQ